MKRCPTCNRTFTDQNLSFCIDDGSPLIAIADTDEGTVVNPRSDTADHDWGSVAYRPPTSYVPTDTPKRRVWPWLLVVGGVIVLGLVGLVVAGAVFIPRMIRQQEQARQDSSPPVESPPGLNTNKSESGPPVVSDPNSPVPTDKDAVLAQLTELENEWTVANINADKQKLERILADDYVGPATADPNGPTQGKDEYIRTIRRDTQIQKWEFKDLQLTLRGDRATLVGKVHFTVRGQALVLNFSDKFVWRDGRWQATGSQVTPVDGTAGTDL
jgi:hypothetical protein